MVLSRVRLTVTYATVQELHEEKHYAIYDLCEVCGLNRSSYYKWLNREKSSQELENKKVLHWIGELYGKYNGIL